MKLIKALLAVLIILMITSCNANQGLSSDSNANQELPPGVIECIEAEIAECEGFDAEAVFLTDIKKIEHENGDFYLVTCLVESDKYYEYTYAMKFNPDDYNPNSEYEKLFIMDFRVYEGGE